MAFQSPTLEDLERIAAELGSSCPADDGRSIQPYMESMAAGYAWLDAQQNALPQVSLADRDYRYPDSGDNPLGAWYVKSAIKESDSGPLHGKRVAVKDNIFVAGIPMMDGSTMLEGFVPDYDATVVSRMLDAGAEIAGKSVCECLCMSGGSGTAATGPVQNPRKSEYSTGGSSSGSAALVVAGEVEMAIGTDQGGSVRIPASWTGACGMKATHGVVPYTGGMVMETSIDYIGPITRSVADNALLLEVLAGDDSIVQSRPGGYTDRLGRSVNDLRIGIVNEGFDHPLADAEVDECVRAAAARFENLGATVDEISIPEHLNGPAIWGAVVSDGFWQSFKLNGLGYNYDGVYSPALYGLMEDRRDKFDDLPVNAKMLFMLGKYLERYRGYYYGKAKNLVHVLRAAYDRALSGCDLLLMPTTVQKSSRNPDITDPAQSDLVMAQAFNNTFNTCQFNSSGHPAMSIPCGMRDGLPIGLMLVGRHFEEATIYQAAHAFEQSEDWTAL